MKKKFLILSVVVAAFAFTACNDDNSAFDNPGSSLLPGVEVSRATFAKDDGSPSLPSTPNEKAVCLLLKTNAEECTDTLGRANITEAQYAEIKAFTDDLVKGCTTQKEIFMACYKWVSTNIAYEHSDNDPYAVFKNRKGICQGYANLLFIMLHGQGVPSMVCNGQITQVAWGGHAWNYVCCDGAWWVADPTNPGVGGPWGAKAITQFSHLLPMSLDVVLFRENECWFDYYGYNLNICNITSNETTFTVPFSVGGYQVTSLCPTVSISPSVKELNIGKNITSLGENYMGLMYNAPNVEYVNVDPENSTFASNLGVVYRRNGNELQLTYIPAAMKCVELVPMETMYKNTVYEHNGVETLIVAPGTKRIESWGVENCPNLKIAYVPNDTELADNAFTGVHPDFQIIRGDYTNIPEVRE